MKVTAPVLLLLTVISVTKSLEDDERNLRGGDDVDANVEFDDEDDADLLAFRTNDITDIFQLGTPTWGGSGCPEGTVHVVTSPEDIPGESGVNAVTVIFDAYVAETSPTSTREYRGCALAIPLIAKPGFQIGIFQVSPDYTEFHLYWEYDFMCKTNHFLALTLADRLPRKHLRPEGPWIHVAVQCRILLQWIAWPPGATDFRSKWPRPWSE